MTQHELEVHLSDFNSWLHVRSMWFSFVEFVGCCVVFVDAYLFYGCVSIVVFFWSFATMTLFFNPMPGGVCRIRGVGFWLVDSCCIAFYGFS